VKSRILEEHRNLAANNYNLVIGLRDAPKNRMDIPRLRAGLPVGVPPAPPSVLFLLAVMEIEAWFLAEHTHFPKIDQNLSAALVHEKLGFDPSVEDMRLRDRPAQDLNEVYQLVSERYQKGRAAQRTILLLDYARIVCEMGENEPDIKQLVETITAFLSPDETRLPEPTSPTDTTTPGQ
jgi:hypothetical protein